MEQKNFDPDGVGVDNGTYFGLPFAPATAWTTEPISDFRSLPKRRNWC